MSRCLDFLDCLPRLDPFCDAPVFCLLPLLPGDAFAATSTTASSAEICSLSEVCCNCCCCCCLCCAACNTSETAQTFENLKCMLSFNFVYSKSCAWCKILHAMSSNTLYMLRVGFLGRTPESQRCVRQQVLHNNCVLAPSMCSNICSTLRCSGADPATAEH